MDNIITLVVVIIFVVSTIIRIKAAQKPKNGGKPVPSSDLGKKLKTFFAEIQRKLEEQAAGRPPDSSRWEELSDAGQTSQMSPPDDEMSLEDLELEPVKAQPSSPKPVRKPPSRPAMDRSQPPEERPHGGHPEPCKGEPMPANAASCPEFLRRAVVWSEILGPPVALRDSPWDR
jgi:cell division septation protein DedD